MLRYIAFLYALFLLLVITSNAQNTQQKTLPSRDIEMIRYDQPESGVPSFIALRSGTLVPAENFTEWIKIPLRMQTDDGWQEFTSHQDGLGQTHTKYLQYYKNVAVEDGMYIAHTKEGILRSANGTFVDGLMMDVKPAILETEALNASLAYVNAEKYAWEDVAFASRVGIETTPHGELVITRDTRSEKKVYTLSYRFDMYSINPFGRQFVYIDAQSGAMIKAKNRMCNNAATGTATTMYSGIQPVTTDSVAVDSFYMRDLTKAKGVFCYNDLTKTLYVDSNNVWDTITSKAATDAYWAILKSYEYFQIKQNRNQIGFTAKAGLGNKKDLMNISVHVGNNLNDAQYDGSNSIICGDGDGTLFGPWISLETLGHEYTHNVSITAAQWSNTGEPGALNEAVSDMFGMVIEEYFKDTSSYANWRVGDEHMYSHQGFRDLSNPKMFSHPDTYMGQYWDPGAAADPHKNGMVAGKWFSLMTDGGSGTNDKGNAYNVTGVGIDTAANIVYNAVMNYATSTTNFAAFRTQTIQTAIDFYGDCSQPVISTTDAWYAVGLDTSYITPVLSVDFSVSDTLLCMPAESSVKFYNNTRGGTTFVWDFGDGTTSTEQDPLHTYLSPGQFTVKLVADGTGCAGSIDSLTKTNVIRAVTTYKPLITKVGDSLYVFPSGKSRYWYRGNGLYVSYQPAIKAIVSDGYYAYVTDSNGCKVYSDTVAVIVGVAEQQKIVPDLSVYPNPGRDIFTVDFASAQNLSLTIEVFNVLGVKVKELYAPVKSGENSLSLNLGNISSGVYFVCFKSKDFSLTRKIVKK